jgi:hypothetical protein
VVVEVQEEGFGLGPPLHCGLRSKRKIAKREKNLREAAKGKAQL